MRATFAKGCDGGRDAATLEHPGYRCFAIGRMIIAGGHRVD
jgi:hypothetical protein